MLKEKITYTDYFGDKRTETFCFNLNKAELADLQNFTAGGFDEYVKRIVAAKDVPSLARIFKDLVLRSYGEISPDGKRFIKSEELSTAFSQTEAFVELYMKLAQDDEYAMAFIRGILPPDLQSEISKEDAVKLLEG